MRGILLFFMCSMFQGLIASGGGRGRSSSGGGGYAFIPSGASASGYSTSLGVTEGILAYLGICGECSTLMNSLLHLLFSSDTASRCVPPDQAAALRDCFARLEDYPSIRDRLRSCAICCELDCTAANVQRFVPCFASLGQSLGQYAFPETVICCFRQNLSISAIDCLRNLYPNFAIYVSNIQG